MKRLFPRRIKKPIIFNEGSQSSFKVEINERVKLVELLDEIQKGTIKN